MDKKTKGEQTRDNIIDVATQLFVSQGFHATTTRQITDRLEMARGAIYNHFKSKDAIFEAALERYHPWFHIPASVEAAEGETIEELVRNAADRMLIAWDRQPELIRLHLIELIEFQGEHLPGLFDTVFSQMTGVLHRITETREEFSTIPVATLSRALLGLFFAFLMADRFTGIPSMASFNQNTFGYFADAYLHGVISQEDYQEPEDFD